DDRRRDLALGHRLVELAQIAIDEPRLRLDNTVKPENERILLVRVVARRQIYIQVPLLAQGGGPDAVVVAGGVSVSAEDAVKTCRGNGQAQVAKEWSGRHGPRQPQKQQKRYKQSGPHRRRVLSVE